MAINVHDYGDLVRVSVTFRDATTEGVLDPDVVKLTLKKPNGDLSTLTYGTDAEVIKDGLGEYHADISADQSGTWFYRWWSTGDGQASEERWFEVRAAQAIEDA